jgi:hypothetical protein
MWVIYNGMIIMFISLSSVTLHNQQLRQLVRLVFRLDGFMLRISRFEVFKAAVTMKITVFQNLTPCILVDRYRRFASGGPDFEEHHNRDALGETVALTRNDRGQYGWENIRTFFVYREDRGSAFFRNVYNFLQDYTLSYTRR